MSATREQVIEYLRCKGLDGATFSEIQRFVCSLNGLDYDEKVPGLVWNSATKTLQERPVRRYRGYWCTNLCGLSSPYSKREGILQKYCVKMPNKHYVLKENL